MGTCDLLSEAHAFANDHGEIDPVLREALSCSVQERHTRVVNALARGRVLMGIKPGASPSGSDSGSVHGSELYQIPLENGSSAYAAFSCYSAYCEFFDHSVHASRVRPIPVAISEACAIALVRGEGNIVLDPQSDHYQLFGRSVVTALATGQAWEPAGEYSHIADALMARINVSEHAYVRRLSVQPDGHGRIVVSIECAPDISRKQAEAVIDTLGRCVHEEPLVRGRYDWVNICPARAQE